MIERLRRLLLKEFQQMLRDPRMRVLIFFMPVLQMVLFAFALTTDVTRVSLGVVDLDKTQTSRRLAESFTSSGWFRVEAYADSDRAMSGRWIGAMSAPSCAFRPSSSRHPRGRTAQVQVLTDGSDSNTATIVFGYASRIVDAFAQTYLDQRLAARLGPGRSPAQVSFETRAWFNPNLESGCSMCPASSARCCWWSPCSFGPAVVREKEIGTIEQIMVTPITRLEFILARPSPICLSAT